MQTLLADKLSIEQAAVVAGCSSRTIARALQVGDLRSAKIDGRVMIARADFDRWSTRHASGHAFAFTTTTAEEVLDVALRLFSAARSQNTTARETTTI